MTYLEFKNSRDHFTVDEYANVKTIEELEKIKTEFENKEGVFTSYHFIKVIDNHISELKGSD